MCVCSVNFNRLQNHNMETRMDSYWMFINFTVDLCHIIDTNTFIQEVHTKEWELQNNDS